MDKVELSAKYFEHQILEQLYPLINEKLQQLDYLADWKEHEDVYYAVLELAQEFRSLTYYEEKLVFPCLMESYYKNQSLHLMQNPKEIIRLTSLKEKRIQQLACNVEKLAINEGFQEKHVIFDFTFLFQDKFMEVKESWRNFLTRINDIKVCPFMN